MNVKRKFIPGTEWIYLKVYGGSKMLERILVHDLFSVTDQFVRQNIAAHYFFIHYADPDYHIRLRVFTKNPGNIYPVISGWNSVLTDKIRNRSIYRISLDTYNREFERYGENSVELVEQLFYFDSVSILRFLYLTGRLDDHRWLYSMYWIDQLLDSFQFSDERKSHFLDFNYQNYAQEMGIQKPARIIMDRKYRKFTGEIERVYKEEETGEISRRYIISVVSTYLEDSMDTISQLLRMDSLGDLPVAFESLVSSIIHMHVNRMFRTRQRNYELLIYYFLLKYHKSRLARAKM